MVFRRKKTLEGFTADDFFIDQRGFFRFKKSGASAQSRFSEAFVNEVQRRQFGLAKNIRSRFERRDF
jgi:hypothetical protein